MIMINVRKQNRNHLPALLRLPSQLDTVYMYKCWKYVQYICTYVVNYSTTKFKLDSYMFVRVELLGKFGVKLMGCM